MQKVQPKKMPQQESMHSFKLAEGLQRKSLDYLVQPILSIDEFESKISDKRVIVVGFYCGDKDPATDLSNFIDKSSQPILDTEVSPAPTTEGYYVTWVEIARNAEFPKVLLELLDEVDNLTNVEQWQFQSPGNKDPQDIDKKNLSATLILDPDKIIDLPDTEPESTEQEEPKTKAPKPQEPTAEEPAAEQPTAEEPTAEEPTAEEPAAKEPTAELQEFWLSAIVDNIIIENSNVTLRRYGNERTYKISHKFPEKINFLFESSEGKLLQKWLGPAYNVYQAENGFVVERDNKALFAVPID